MTLWLRFRLFLYRLTVFKRNPHWLGFVKLSYPCPENISEEMDTSPFWSEWVLNREVYEWLLENALWWDWISLEAPLQDRSYFVFARKEDALLFKMVWG